MSEEKTLEDYIAEVNQEAEVFEELAMLYELEAQALREVKEEEEYMKRDLEMMVKKLKKNAFDKLNELEAQGK